MSAIDMNNAIGWIEDQAKKKGFMKIGGNIWRAESEVEKKLRAEHALYGGVSPNRRKFRHAKSEI